MSAGVNVWILTNLPQSSDYHLRRGGKITEKKIRKKRKKWSVHKVITKYATSYYNASVMLKYAYSNG